MTDVERAAALEAIAEEVRACTRCRLHEGRTRAVPGEGSPDTEVVFVGEGPGFNEDRQGRPFVGRAGSLLTQLLASIGWRREDVFITNVVKCRPPENRDPEPDEIAACAPFLARQLEVLDPALVVFQAVLDGRDGPLKHSADQRQGVVGVVDALVHLVEPRVDLVEPSIQPLDFIEHLQEQVAASRRRHSNSSVLT